ncbi:MAG: hypothetical protein MRJ68_00745 [Nitrospira sp.]|nr:hypothetical protein [Nitrospira sp.]
MKRKSEKTDRSRVSVGRETPVRPDPRPILLAEKRDPAGVRAMLSAYGLRDPDQADRNLNAMAAAIPSNGGG